MNAIIKSNWKKRAIALLFIVPACLLFAFVGVHSLMESTTIGESVVGVIFVIVSALLVCWLAFITTLQIELRDDLIIRRSFFGETIIRAENIKETKLGVFRRGQTILTIRTQDSWKMLPSVSFEKADLLFVDKTIREMRAQIAANIS